MHFQPQLLCDLSCHESSESEIQGKKGCKKNKAGDLQLFFPAVSIWLKDYTLK